MDPLNIRYQVQTGIKSVRRKLGHEPTSRSYALVQEEVGIHVGISPDLPETARHATRILMEKYQAWWDRGRFSAWGQYKRQYFTIAVGGGNTLKAQYQSMVELLHTEIAWIHHVRFFFLEASSGEPKWESAEQSLILNFIVPLAQKMLKVRGRRTLAKDLQLDAASDEDAIIDRMILIMINPINLAEVKQAIDAGRRPLALKKARTEARRYQSDIQDKLGSTMVFHYIMSGIGKNGTLGALGPYMPELSMKSPEAIVLKQDNKALRIALNRGVLINGECISLIVSGNLKLRALGRFEMEESAGFEQTVMETPLRMLRETRAIAEKVYIFADEQALHFDETTFEYREQGQMLSNKAETREGEEPRGPHILLLHGFMGLFSFTSFLVRLPSAWTVSALHRGSRAKTLDKTDVFPHYARFLRQVILNIWAQGQPTPVAGHSIAGVILDHLMLSLLNNDDAPITPYKKLTGDNRKLVDALRASGIIHLATWAPTDGLHAGENIKSLASHYRQNTDLDYSGFDAVYSEKDGHLKTTEESSVSDKDSLRRFDRFLNTPIAKPIVSSLNVAMRGLLNNKTVQQGMLNTNSPYVLRLVGKRLLKTASFYGMCKEINAAMHAPVEYQRRHLKALDIILEYDIPFLSIVHEDDFLVSAKRHRQEFDYLLRHRKRKEGVTKAAELQTTVRYVKLKRAQEILPVDPLNPHLMIMATSNEANNMARQITAAITRFVNENIDKGARAAGLKPPASVNKWIKENTPRSKRKTVRPARATQA